MKVIRNELPLPFDVDDTLVMHDTKCVPGAEIVFVQDPLNKNRKIRLRKNLPMIRILMEEKLRGGFVVVWSKGGFQWAENVLKACGLTKHVDLVMTKPRAYCDDKDVSEWLKERVYLPPDVAYKK